MGMKRGVAASVWFRTIGAVMIVLIASLLTIAVLHRYHSAPVDLEPVVQSDTATPNASDAVEVSWPSYGQSAIATADGVVATHGETASQPTASTAKLITALAVMRQRPFEDGAGGRIIFSRTDVERYETYLAGGGTVTQVTEGARWTQFQALEAVLLDSANNVSDTLAVWAFGSLEAYRSYAQEMVRELGMNDTVIGSDASGYDPSTVSTAHDLALLAAAVLDEPTLRAITAQQTADIPGVGVITNTNYLLEHSDIIGLKTGWIPGAGGVFVLAGTQEIEGHSHEVITVVMGAPGDSSRQAQDDAYSLYESAKQNFSYQEIVAKDQQLGVYQPGWRGEVAFHAAESLGVFIWSGDTPTVTVDVRAGHPGDEGEVGKLTVTSQIGAHSVPIVIAHSIDTPSLWWRMIQP